MTKKSLFQMNHRILLGLLRNSHRRCSVKEGVPKKFANFTQKHLCWSLFLIKLTALLLKTDSNTRVFPWNFLITSILKNTCERLLLFVSPQNTIANSRGEFGLDETLTEWKVSIFLCITILFDQIMEILKRRRNNSEKQPCFGNNFFQLESRKTRAWSS